MSLLYPRYSVAVNPKKLFARHAPYESDPPGLIRRIRFARHAAAFPCFRSYTWKVPLGSGPEVRVQPGGGVEVLWEAYQLCMSGEEPPEKAQPAWEGRAGWLEPLVTPPRGRKAGGRDVDRNYYGHGSRSTGRISKGASGAHCSSTTRAGAPHDRMRFCRRFARPV